MDMPPTRYKVVERGRRLQVLDTWEGNRPVGGGPGPATSRGPEAPRDGSAFLTRHWFDNKAPRLIPLNYATRAQVKNLRTAIAIAVAVLVGCFFLFWPFSLLLLFAIGVPQVRMSLREASTRLVDMVDQAATGSNDG